MNRSLVIGAVVLLVLAAWLAWPSETTAPLSEDTAAEAEGEPPVPSRAAAPVGARVAGRVVRDGAGVGKARVTLRAAAPLVTWSMDDGSFLFDDVPSGQVYLSASTRDAASEVLGPLQLQAGGRIEGLSLTLSPALSVEARVMDLLTQRAIAGATVVTPSQAGVTDAQGRFTITGARTQVWVDVSAPGFLSRTEWISLELARAGGKLDVVLTPASRLEGTVTESGAPVTAATVWAEISEGARRGERSLIAFTDREGKFRLECGAGLMQLAAVTPRGTRVKGPLVRVAVGEKKTGLKLDAPDVSAAEGVVRLGEQPLPGAQLSALDAATEELSGVATSGPDGRFRFDSLTPGRYVLQVRAAALTTMAGPFEHRGDGASWQVQLVSGKMLSGRVVPASSGVVVRWRSGAWAGPSAQTVTDGEGRFRFEGLPDEVVTVDAEGPSGAATVRARAGVEVVLTLRKAEVLVHLQDDRGGPVTDGVITARSLETGSLRRQLVLAPDGVARLDLSIGRWELTLEAGRGRSAPVQVDVTDQGAQATLSLQPQAVVAGTVVEKESGLPIANARVEAFSGDFGRALRVVVLTDERGAFALPPVPRESSVRVEREGFRPNYQPAGSAMRFTLERAAPTDKPGATEVQFEGVGMTLDARSGPVLVALVSDGSPAERAGVLAGDQILMVDGVAVAGQRLDAVVARIRGPAGTPVTLQFQRAGQVFELTLRRKMLNL